MDFYYQQLAIRQRNRHRREYGKYWPDKPASEPIVSRYPNILAELDASTGWLNRAAGHAMVSMEIMVSVMEDNAELSREELAGISRGYGCSMNYLLSPVLSMVDPVSNKGKARIQHLRELVRQTEGMDRFFYETFYSDVLPTMESGKPVTYAVYRWTCKRLQDLLDWQAQAKTWKRHVRTGGAPPKPKRADLRSKIQQARELDKSRKLEKRLAEINQYVDDVNPKIYCDCTNDLLALIELSKRDLSGALLLAIMDGQAQGCQVAR